MHLAYVDLGGTVAFVSRLTPREEDQPDLVVSGGLGLAHVTSSDARALTVQVAFHGLGGPVTGAHLHLGQAGSNGPVVLDLGAGLGPSEIRVDAVAADLVGPLAGRDLLALVNELAAGNVYVNLHTARYPDGELRGQLELATAP